MKFNNIFNTSLIILLVLATTYHCFAGDIVITENDSTIIRNDTCYITNIDTTIIDDTGKISTNILLQDNSSDTTNAVDSTESLSVWTKYIQPTITVIGAGLVTILLFTVRSK